MATSPGKISLPGQKANHPLGNIRVKISGRLSKTLVNLDISMHGSYDLPDLLIEICQSVQTDRWPYSCSSSQIPWMTSSGFWDDPGYS